MRTTRYTLGMDTIMTVIVWGWNFLGAEDQVDLEVVEEVAAKEVEVPGVHQLADHNLEFLLQVNNNFTV